MKSLNLKLALSLVIGFAVIATSIWFVHKYQVQRRSVRSLAEAEEQFAKKDYKTALNSIRRYRYYNPLNKEAMQLQIKIAAEQFALLKKERDPTKAFSQEFVEAYRDLAGSYEEYFLKYDGTSDDIQMHKDYLDFAITPGIPFNVTVANQEIRQLMRLKYKSPDFSFQQAQLLEQKNDLPAAAALYAEIVGYNLETKTFDPEVSAKAKKIDAYFRLAACLSQINKGTDEDLAVINEMQSRHPEEARAQFYAYVFFRTRPALIEDAKKALNTAYQLDRNDSDIQFAMYQFYMLTGESKKAQEIAVMMRKSDANNPQRFKLESDSLVRQGNIPEALKVIEQGLAVQADDPQLLDAKVNLQINVVPTSKDPKKDLKEARKTWEAYRDVVTKKYSSFAGKMKYVDAQLTFLEGKPKEALEIAKNAKESLPDTSESIKVDMFIANCHLRLGQIEDARKTFEQIERIVAEARDPQMLQSGFDARIALAKIYFATNKRREAIAKLEQIRTNVRPEKFFYLRDLWKPLVSSWINDEAVKPAEKRDWTKVDKYVAQALAQPDEVVSADEKTLLQINVHAGKGDLDKAIEQAVQMRTKDPSQITAWGLWAGLMDQKNATEEIIQGIDSAPDSVKQHPQIIRLKAAAYQKIGGERAATGLEQMIENSKKNSPKEQVETLIAVGRLRFSAGKVEEAKSNFRSAQKLAEQYNLSELQILAYDRLIGAARETNNVAEMQALVKEIRGVKNVSEIGFQIIGAQQLMMQIRESVRKRLKEGQSTIELTAEEKKWLDEIVVILDKIETSKTEWSELLVMRADIASLQNKTAEQISYMRTAFEKRELNPARSRQLAELLQATGNFTEANRVLETIADRAPDDNGLLKLKISNLLALGKPEEAKPFVDSIKFDLEKASIEELFWYANVNRGVKNFDKAIELARLVISKDPDFKYANVWPVLIMTYVDKGDKEGAKAAIAEITNKPASELRELIAAACAEVMGDVKEAIRYYDQAVASYPDSLRIRRQVVEFNIRNGLADGARRAAEDVAIILKKNPNDPLAAETATWLLRAKATIIAKSNPSYDAFLEADKLLADAIKEGDKASIPELTLRVNLLADRTEPESIRKAIDLMEKLRALNQDLPVAQQLILADLHQRVGNWPKAKEIMDSLVVKTKDDPIVGLTYAEMLVRNADELSAKEMLDKYLVVAPEQKEKLAMLRATVLIKLRKADAGYAVLNEWVGSGPYKKEDFAKLKTVAELLETLNQTAEARKYFLELSKIDAIGKGMYGKFVGRYDDMVKGLAILEETGRDRRVLPLCVQSAASVIRFNKNKINASNQAIVDQYYSAIDRWLEDMLRLTPDNLQVGILKAEVTELKGDLVQTVALYRSLLQSQKLDAKFRAQLNNNLAYIIAIQNDTASMPEAHQLVENAIKTHGPDSDVLDTRGTLNLFEKKYELALQDFKDAVLVPTHLKYFHLALANFKLGYLTPAREAMAKAESLNFEPRDLNTEEHKLYEEMKKGLNPDQTAINAN